MKKRTIFFFLASLCLMVAGGYGLKVAFTPDGEPSSPGSEHPPQISGEGEPQKGNIFIYGEVSSNQPVDTLFIKLWENYLGKFISDPGPEIKSMPLNEGSLMEGALDKRVFSYSSGEITDIGYLTIGDNKASLLNLFMVRPGDSVYIHIDLKKGMTTFSGRSADRFRIQHEVELARQTYKMGQDPVMVTGSKDRFLKSGNYRDQYETAQKSPYRKMKFVETENEKVAIMEQELVKIKNGNYPGIDILNANKHLMDRVDREVLKSRIIGETLYKTFNSFNISYRKDSDEFNRLYNEYILETPLVDFDADIVINSPLYMDYLMERIVVESKVHGEPFYKIVERNFDSPLRDRLWGKFLMSYFSIYPHSGEMLREILPKVSDSVVLTPLTNLSRQAIGTPMKELSLPDSNGDTVRLSDFQGKVVLIDFWFTGCLPCVELFRTTVHPVELKYGQREDFVVVSIAADRNKDVWKKSLSEGRYSSAEAINLFMEDRFKHPFLKYYDIQAFPRLILLDKKGRIFRTSGLMDKYDLENAIESALAEK
ncbi:TlpA family protein disulfide reductase [Litoribacter populi]|uniref:TlpA family protein disulfide reductase n=1 Tax=Litoribacter populi TaxID=2598460 RepID=UPI00117C6F5B|nr:TlpA disulfide reductase family protein [Litoribacter populi]